MTRFNTTMRPVRTIFLSASLLAVTACATVGPDYGGAPDVAARSAERGSYLRAPEQAVLASPAAAWWEQLNDPVLDGIVEDALANAPSIDAAIARVDQARANLRSSRTAALPTVGTSAAAPYINIPADLVDSESTRDRYSAESLSLGFDASWEIDLFGQNRRRVEAGSARVEASEASLADAQVSLSAEIARVYVGLRARQEMASIMEEQLAIDRQLLALARQRHDEGTGTLHPVEQMRTRVAQTLADIAQNNVEIVVARDQLAVLAGREPGALDTLLSAEMGIPLPPEQVAIGSPADMLRLRPDIRQAERNLAAASADIGVNVADRFPKVSFLGLLGLGGGSIDDTLDPSRLIGLALPRISWTAFDGGRTEARIDASRSAYEEAEANYRSAVLGALGDTENALARFGGARIALGQTVAAHTSAARSAQLDAMRADAGTTSRSTALEAERAALQLELSGAAARADLAEAFVSLNKALGLGWQQD